MGFFTVLLLGVALSMDAFAVAVCKGLAMKKIRFYQCYIVGAWFGIFQGIMPLFGYLLGVNFSSYIEHIAPWIACILLVLIGADMIKEAVSQKEEDEETDTLNVKEMFFLSIATSIDALAVGITFVCEPVKIVKGMGKYPNLTNTLIACGIIALMTWLLSMSAVKIGNVFGTRFKAKAEIAGGVILVLLGVKILLESFGVF